MDYNLELVTEIILCYIFSNCQQMTLERQFMNISTINAQLWLLLVSGPTSCITLKSFTFVLVLILVDFNDVLMSKD